MKRLVALLAVLAALVAVSATPALAGPNRPGLDSIRTYALD